MHGLAQDGKISQAWVCLLEGLSLIVSIHSFTHLYMFIIHSSVCRQVHRSVHTCAYAPGGQSSPSYGSLGYSPPHFLRQGLSLNLELADLARQSPGILLSQPLSVWIYRYISLSLESFVLALLTESSP